MFAIFVTPRNGQTILDHNRSLGDDQPHLNLDVYFESARNWYYVQGWVSERGAVIPWTILPEYILVTYYEFDPDRILTGWDQIVRK